MDPVKVSVVGLGYVGAALSVALASRKSNVGENIFSVTGIDVPSQAGLKRINDLNHRKFPFESCDESLKHALAHVPHEALICFCDYDCVESSEVVFLCVDCDVSQVPNITADFTNLRSACKGIGRFIGHDCLVVVESTVPPGTTENVVYHELKCAFEKRGITSTPLVGHSYERVMPGPEYLNSIVGMPRVIGASDPSVAARIKSVYSKLLESSDEKITILNCSRDSEIAKVLENTFRAVNIALIEEWTTWIESIGGDLWSILDAIRERPTHKNIMNPGFGVGGYCLTKDPFFGLIADSLFFETGTDFPVARKALEINYQMTENRLNRVEQKLNIPLKNAKLLLCGVAYRDSVSDTRYSPSEAFAKKAITRGASIDYFDPFVEYWDELGMSSLESLVDIEIYDAIIFCVAHKHFRSFDLTGLATKSSPPLVFDFCGVLPRNTFDGCNDDSSSMRVTVVGVE